MVVLLISDWMLLSRFLGSGALFPQAPIDAIMPGAGKLVTAGAAIGKAVMSPF